jgi:Tetratricopeptide repeat
LIFRCCHSMTSRSDHACLPSLILIGEGNSRFLILILSVDSEPNPLRGSTSRRRRKRSAAPAVRTRSSIFFAIAVRRGSSKHSAGRYLVGLVADIGKLVSLSIELKYGLLSDSVREQNKLSTTVSDTHEIRVKMPIPTQVSLEWSGCPDGYEIVPPDGDPLEPAEVYVAILGQDPQNASALAGLARCYLNSGDVERADQIIKQLVPGELPNPTVKRAFRDFRHAGWAELERQAYPERVRLPALPNEWTHRLRARTSAVTPLNHDPRLYRKFAGLEFAPDCYRKFADECGVLTDGYSPPLWVYARFHACVRQALGLPIPAEVLQRFDTSSISRMRQP